MARKKTRLALTTALAFEQLYGPVFAQTVVQQQPDTALPEVKVVSSREYPAGKQVPTFFELTPLNATEPERVPMSSSHTWPRASVLRPRTASSQSSLPSRGVFHASSGNGASVGGPVKTETRSGVSYIG